MHPWKLTARPSQIGVGLDDQFPHFETWGILLVGAVSFQEGDGPTNSEAQVFGQCEPVMNHGGCLFACGGASITLQIILHYSEQAMVG